MYRHTASFSAVLLLSACLDGQNPLVNTGGDDLDLPPGTDNPTASGAIERYEAYDATTGDGFATDISYDAATDTFTVDNLAFDGDNTYARDTTVPSLGSAQVYAADDFTPDAATGYPIWQFLHRGVREESASGNTTYAIVRTGNYVGYGFGGFVYSREIGVDLPTSGQAHFEGNYAGLRDYSGRADLHYVTGLAEVDIDFEDFNDGNAVRGAIYDREFFDMAGNNVTAAYLADFNTEFDASLASVPVITFHVGPGVMDRNGEITGDVASFYVDNDGTTQQLEAGRYYGLLAGEGADMELVGIVVAEGAFPDGSTARETGGFIGTR